MKPTLSLSRTKEGKPYRLVLTCNYEDKDLAKGAGRGTARWHTKLKAWTYPPDPVVVRNLFDYFGEGMKLSPDLEDYLEQVCEWQQEVIQSTTKQDPVGKPLWPFQVRSVHFLEKTGRAVLGHQMGTGKTPISCVAMDYINASKVLIICPNSVKWSWVDHLDEWSDCSHIYMLESEASKPTDRRATLLQGKTEDREDRLAYTINNQEEFVIILNYDMLRIHQQVFMRHDYDLIIADEAHRLVNRRAQRTEVMEKLSKQSPYVWLLTGTPVRNNYDDLYMLLSMCDPVRFTSYWNFVSLHLESAPRPFGGVDIIGLREREGFNAMLSTYMYRVTKKEVMPDLPDKIYSTLRLEMTPKQSKVYEQMEKEFVLMVESMLEGEKKLEKVLTAPNVVSQMMRLRQICLAPAVLGSQAPSSKLLALQDIVEDLSGQAIVYSCFKQFLGFVEKILQEREIPYALITGDQSSMERNNAVEKLNSGDIQLILGTVQAMGEGLNLQAASTAIFADIDWVPAVNEQAEDRIHRGVIKESPTILRLYHPDTVESDILAVNKRKDRVIGETTGQVEVIREMLLRRR